MAKRLTERQRKSRQAKKIKARQQWQHGLWCKLRSCLLLAALVAIGFITYHVSNGNAQRFIASTMDTTHQSIASTGLAVERINLSGRQRTGMAEVKSVLGVELGESIFKVDLDELRERLESIPTVKKAAASRHFPNRIDVYLVEREPVAVWQNKGELMLIDELGAVMSDLNLHQYNNLPLLVGKAAPQHVAEALKLLADSPELASEVQSMTRVSDRRWNVRFKQGVTVKLPERDYQQAWEKLASMHAEQQLLLRHIEAIDMRNAERMYISVAPEKKQPRRNTQDT